MRPYLLLTPGPLTTSESVKTAMMTDWCTWDEDYNVHIVEEIRKGLVQLATRKTDDYTSILMQGSGTYCVEATKYLWSMWMIIWHTMQKSLMWQWYIAKLQPVS